MSLHFNKAGIITQARMTSTRLPGKVLLKARDKTMLQYHVERLKWSNIPIVIATTTNSTDEPIVEFAMTHQVPFYRGDENNVLSRYMGAAQAFNFDTVVRVTSDCPLIDGNLIRKGVELYQREYNDKLYVSNCLERRYPRGFDFEIFSIGLLKNAYENANLSSDLEHVTPYIHQNRSNNVIFKGVVHNVDKSNYRITLDTEEDRRLIEILINQYGAASLSYSEIIQILDLHPELVAINAHVEQKKFEA